MSAVIWAATLTSKGAAGPRTKKNHGRLITVDERGHCQFHAAMRDQAEAQKVPVA